MAWAAMRFSQTGCRRKTRRRRAGAERVRRGGVEKDQARELAPPRCSQADLDCNEVKLASLAETRVISPAGRSPVGPDSRCGTSGETGRARALARYGSRILATNAGRARALRGRRKDK